MDSNIIGKVIGANEIEENVKEQLKNLKGSIDKMINVLQPEIHQKFEEAKKYDKELVRTEKTLHNLFKDIIKRMDDGHREIMQRPELSIKGPFNHVKI